MAYTTFSKNKNDQLLEPMFFGQNVNVARYDQQKYEVFEKLIEKQLSFFWRPEEIDVTRDAIDYRNLPEHEKHIFISNLKYQTLLDSVQGRGPNIAFLPIVSIPELETWVETWSFSECVAEGTEVLTPYGWKDISKVTTEDDVLVYDLDTEETFFEKPKRTTNYDIDNRLMVEFKSNISKQFHQFVTPNHRMPIKTHVSEGQNPTKKFIEAGLLDYKAHYIAPMSGKVRGNKQKKEELSYLERLLIAAQADGTWKSERYNGERVGTVPIWFEFSKQRKIDRLLLLCELAEVEVVELTGSEEKGNILARRRFKINFPVEHIPDDIKRFDSWVNLLDCSCKYAEDFLEEVSKWDSSIHTAKDGSESFTYTTSVKENADLVQAMAILAGNQGRYAIRKDDRRETYLDIYEVNVVKRTYMFGSAINKNLVPYTGKVYCIETTTGAFVMRYNNVASVTGNTIHSRSYTHIIRNIVNDPSIVFEDIVDNESIQKRAKAVSKYYDDLIFESQLYQIHGEGVWYYKDEETGDVEILQKDDFPVNDEWKKITLRELKKKLYLCIQSVNALEAIRFYVSFALKIVPFIRNNDRKLL